MPYKEKVNGEIDKDELKNLWEKICEAYEQGGSEQVELVLDELASNFKIDYQKSFENLEEIL